VEGTKVDGRRARGLRTRNAIVSALMDLIAAGDVAPTAQHIADRAGVSVRSVYQHFSDVEGLYADASTRTYERVVSMVTPHRPRVAPRTPHRRVQLITGGDSRVDHPFSRASRVVEPTSESVRRNRLALQQESRERLAAAFKPELSTLPNPVRVNTLCALDALTSWSAWDHLRSTGLSAKSARQVIRAGIVALLACPAC